MPSKSTVLSDWSNVRNIQLLVDSWGTILTYVSSPGNPRYKYADLNINKMLK